MHLYTTKNGHLKTRLKLFSASVSLEYRHPKNEMVSTGDTEISFHIPSPKFRASWRGGGYSRVKTENTQSAKIWLNFNFRGGWGVGWWWGVLWSQNWKYSKCQDLPKFQFSGGGGYSGSQNWKYSKCKICLNLGGGLSGLQFQRGALWRIWTQIYCLRLVYRNLLVHHR